MARCLNSYAYPDINITNNGIKAVWLNVIEKISITLIATSNGINSFCSSGFAKLLYFIIFLKQKKY